MLEEVRCLKVNQLKDEIEKLKMQYAAMFDEVNTINGQLWVLRYAEKQVENYQSQKHSFWDRFLKRKAYLEYRANLSTIDHSQEKIAMLSDRLADAESRVLENITKSDIKQKIEKLEAKVHLFKSATSLDQLGLTPMQAVSLLQNNGITPVWGDGDFEIYSRMHNSTDETELVTVGMIDKTFKTARLAQIGDFDFQHGKKINASEKTF